MKEGTRRSPPPHLPRHAGRREVQREPCILVIRQTQEQPCFPFGVQSLMYDPTASHRHHKTLPASAAHSRLTRLTFPRILTTATIALALSVAMPGCRGSKNQSAATPSGDPSDVNAAEAQSSCPAGQVLMSDGSCGSAHQPQTAQQGPAQAPAQAPTPSYAPQPSQQAPAP